MIDMYSKIRHSDLYYLEPIDIESAFRESLTSYINRLAIAHCVPNKVLIEYLSSKSNTIRNISNNAYFYNTGAKSINGYNIYAKEFSHIISAETCARDIVFLTMLPLANILDPAGKGVFKRHKEWCPYCFRDFKKKYKFVYEPLIWNITRYVTCHIHSCQLSKTCHHCGNHQPFLSRLTYIGYCATCGKDLAKQNSKPNSKNTLTLEADTIDYSEYIVTFFSDIKQTDKVSPDNFIKNLTTIITKATSGNAKKLNNILGLGTSTLSQWRRGRCLPMFDLILEFAFKLNISLSDLLCNEANNFELPSIQHDKRSSSLNNSLRNHEYIENELKNFILDNEMLLSVRKIAERLNVSVGYLQYRHEPYINMLVNKSIRLRENLKVLQHAEIIKNICIAVFTLHNSGIYPSQRMVFSQAFNLHKLFLKKDKYLKVWREAKRVLGYGE